MLLAEDRRSTKQGGRDREDLEGGLEDRLHRHAEVRQVLQDTRLLLKALSYFSWRPAGLLRGFENHQLMSDFAQDVGGGDPLNLVVLDPLD